MFKKVFKLYKGLENILSDPFLIIIGPLLLVFTFFAKNSLANFIFFLVFGFYFIFFLMFIFFEKALPFLFLLQIREPVFYFLKKIDTDSRSKRTFATLLTPSLLKKLYQNPVIKKKVDQQPTS